MTGARKRGRPRKIGLFQNGSAPSGRSLSPLGEAVRTGQREFFKELRGEFCAGTRLKNDMISEVLKYSDGDPQDEIARIAAEEKISNAKLEARQQSISGGEKRSRLSAEIKSRIIKDHEALFEKVRNGKMTANSAASWLRDSLVRNKRRKGTEPNHEREGWVPSVRELNEWFAEYRQN